jgi:hypothetical protein
LEPRVRLKNEVTSIRRGGFMTCSRIAHFEA